MEIIESIFKAYDIRGIYPTEVNEEVAYRLGRAYVEMIKKELNKEKVELVVTQDSRISSPSISKRLIEGMLDQGADVVDCGIASTPTFYFAVAKYGYDGGIQVSASHNPPEYNGFKMVRHEAITVSKDTGIMELKEAVKKNDFPTIEKKGQAQVREGVVADQVKHALSYVDVDKLKPFKVVIDAANGVGALMFEALFEKLPCELIKLNFELDGSFPNHEADPLNDENNEQLHKKVVELDADFGIALDGDGDRIFFVTKDKNKEIKAKVLETGADLGIHIDGDSDRMQLITEKGKTVEPAVVRGILSKIFLKDNPGRKVCYDVRPGKITIDMIKENGGVPVVTKVGHSLIKEKAREVDAIFAGESSGHFFVRTDFGFFEEPLIITLVMLEEISNSGQNFSEYIHPLYRYHHSGEINSTVEDKNAVFNRLREKYKDNLTHDFDGLSFEFEDWWFNVRASNTENKMRLNLESSAEDVMQKKTKEVLDIIVK